VLCTPWAAFTANAVADAGGTGLPLAGAPPGPPCCCCALKMPAVGWRPVPIIGLLGAGADWSTAGFGAITDSGEGLLRPMSVIRRKNWSCICAATCCCSGVRLTSRGCKRIVGIAVPPFCPVVLS